MILQWIIVSALVVGAAIYIIRRSLWAFRTRGCAACERSRGSRFLRWLERKGAQLKENRTK